MVWPDFKSGWGRQPFLGGFDSHCPPPIHPPPVRFGSELSFEGLNAIIPGIKTIALCLPGKGRDSLFTLQ